MKYELEHRKARPKQTKNSENSQHTDENDLTAKTNEVTQKFLGAELATAIFACPSSFGGYGKLDTDTFFR